MILKWNKYNLKKNLVSLKRVLILKPKNFKMTNKESKSKFKIFNKN